MRLGREAEQDHMSEERISDPLDPLYDELYNGIRDVLTDRRQDPSEALESMNQFPPDVYRFWANNFLTLGEELTRYEDFKGKGNQGIAKSKYMV